MVFSKYTSEVPLLDDGLSFWKKLGIICTAAIASITLMLMLWKYVSTPYFYLQQQIQVEGQRRNTADSLLFFQMARNEVHISLIDDIVSEPLSIAERRRLINKLRNH